MPYKRFKAISRYLHFVVDLPANANDKLKKVRPVVNHLTNKFKNIYIPGENISIDESLMKFRGRLSFVQFNPSKRARFGIKFYKVGSSENGYCWNFKMYTEKIMQELMATPMEKSCWQVKKWC